jgi:stage V sporulation protein D (sporulation-specific penicillin-binding protein)
MDDPQYIVLVALDTPSRETGIYISGGVMAAPTVGVVMADILPYLGVTQKFSSEDAAGHTVVLENFTGMPLEEARQWLARQGLTVVTEGSGDHVIAQIPAPGETVFGESQVLLYLGQREAPQEETASPDAIPENKKKFTHTQAAIAQPEQEKQYETERIAPRHRRFGNQCRSGTGNQRRDL